MTRLCFGTYAKALQKALQQPSTNQAVAELLLELITKNANPNDIGADFSIKPKMVSEWFSLQRDINKEIVALASSLQVIASAQRGFSDRVVVCLVPNLILDLISELCELVQGDNTISSEQKDALLLNAHKDTLSDFLSATFLYALHKSNKLLPNAANAEISAELAPSPLDVDNLKKILSQFKPPDRLPVPPNPIEDEMAYIQALLAAYAEAAGIDTLSKDQLPSYPRFQKDLAQRRKEYYAAESVRRGTQEVFGREDADAFSVLKDETYDGVFDVHSKDFPHGFDRLLAVMEQASSITINRCLLSRTNWIGSSEKKGVCHILVNDGAISWVVHDE